jgi:hypothetical protein
MQTKFSLIVMLGLLTVPTITLADSLSLGQIAQELKQDTTSTKCREPAGQEPIGCASCRATHAVRTGLASAEHRCGATLRLSRQGIARSSRKATLGFANNFLAQRLRSKPRPIVRFLATVDCIEWVTAPFKSLRY